MRGFTELYFQIFANCVVNSIDYNSHFFPLKKYFSDGSSAEVDAIIFCTGYLHHYPYLEENIRLRSPNVLYPHKCYKGIVYTEGGNNKVLYCGIQDQYYTYTMFDAVALWAFKYVLGEIKLPNKAAMVADWKKWVDR